MNLYYVCGLQCTANGDVIPFQSTPFNHKCEAQAELDWLSKNTTFLTSLRIKEIHVVL